MATTDNRIHLVENDTADIIRCKWDGIDLTGYRIYLKIGYDAAIGPPLSKEATITDAENGVFQFEFVYGDLKPGSAEAEILFIDAVGKEKTVKGFYVDIQRRLKRVR